MTSVQVETLRRLMDGNRRFVMGGTMIDVNLGDRRREVAKDHRPLAAVVACSDARVAPELVFDQTLGNIFVVRTAGHALGPEALGSVEYAVERLEVPLVVVMGHTRCGAVEAAVRGEAHHGHLARIVEAVRSARETSQGMPGDPVANAVRANVEASVGKLVSHQGRLARHIREGRLTVVGAIYDLDTGVVSIIPTLKTGR